MQIIRWFPLRSLQSKCTCELFTHPLEWNLWLKGKWQNYTDQMLECIRYSDKQHVGHHLKRNHAKDMSKIIAKSTRAIYNCCQASLGGGGGKGKGRKRLNICLGKWQRRWYICIFLYIYHFCYYDLIFVWGSGNGGDIYFFWILFAVILYPWPKWQWR